MTKQWDLIRTRRVLDKQKINFPDEFQGKIAYNHELHGESVEWNYERNAKVAVVSSAPLTQDRYVHVSRTKVLDNGSNIRPPDDLIGQLSRPFYKGLTVVYLTHEEMLEGETRSVYLLTESQALELMGQPTAESEELKEILFNTPAFLPVPK
jgi:hypothetical protein